MMQEQTARPRHSTEGLPTPPPGARWRWSTARRALVGGGVVATVLSLGTVVANAATSSASKPPASARGGPPPGMSKPTAAGKITALSGDDITLKGMGSTSEAVIYSSSTTFKTPSGSSASASGLKVGQSIAVTGTKQADGSVTASTIVIGAPPPRRGGSPGHAGGKPPSGAGQPSGA